MKITEEMVMRFLNWHLPKDFMPDCGIAFKPPANPNHSWPVGTNLLTAIQARAMLEHVLGATPKGADVLSEAAEIAGREWTTFSQTKQAHERNSTEMFRPRDFGLNYEKAMYSKDCMDRILALRGEQR